MGAARNLVFQGLFKILKKSRIAIKAFY